jgi:hypothetical protein
MLVGLFLYVCQVYKIAILLSTFICFVFLVLRSYFFVKYYIKNHVCFMFIYTTSPLKSEAREQCFYKEKKFIF